MPPKEKVPIEGLLEGYETALARTGYSITTKLLLVRRAELMIRRHLNAGLVYFDQAVINHYMSEIDDKYFKAICRRRTTSEPSVKLTALSALPAREELMLSQVHFVGQGKS